MTLASARVSISTRRKLTSILLAVTIFALLAGLTSFATRGSVVYAIIDSILVGTGVGLFEQFYVQSLRGRWLRSMHPLLSISIYTAVVVLLFVVAVHVSHLLTGRLDTLPIAYRRLPFALPLVIAFSVIGIVVMRTVHFIGIETLFHLMIGTYHRPVIEEKSCCFSTSTTRRVSPSDWVRFRSNLSSASSFSTSPSRSRTTAERSISIRAMV
jgi:hypothetical protein